MHFASAAGLLHADYRTPGDEYSILFKLTDALLHDHSAKEELFRRVTLNVLEHNRDDHLKNFGFLMDAAGRWSLEKPFRPLRFWAVYAIITQNRSGGGVMIVYCLRL